MTSISISHVCAVCETSKRSDSCHVLSKAIAAQSFHHECGDLIVLLYHETNNGFFHQSSTTGCELNILRQVLSRR